MLPILVVCFYEKWEKMGRKSIAFRFPGFPLAKKLFSKTYPSFLTVKEGIFDTPVPLLRRGDP